MSATTYAQYAQRMRASGAQPVCCECSEALSAFTAIKGQAGWYCCQYCLDQSEEGIDFSGDDEDSGQEGT